MAFPSAAQAAAKMAADAKRSEKEKERPRTDEGTFIASVPTGCGDTGSRDRAKEREKETSVIKATASGTNRGTAERMDKLAKDNPDLADKVMNGDMKATEALRQARKEVVEKKIKSLPVER